jgi:hypothetical protein
LPVEENEQNILDVKVHPDGRIISKCFSSKIVLADLVSQKNIHGNFAFVLIVQRSLALVLVVHCSSVLK